MYPLVHDLGAKKVDAAVPMQRSSSLPLAVKGTNSEGERGFIVIKLDNFHILVFNGVDDPDTRRPSTSGRLWPAKILGG